MKNILLLLFIGGFSTTALSQVNKRDSILNEVNNYRATVNNAASTFLNRQLSTAERIKAIAPHPVIYDEKQILEFKRTVLSADEVPAIRAIALNKIYDQVEEDENLFKQVVNWFGNPQTPKELREETLHLLGNLSFSSLVGVLDVYPKMVQDPDINFRTFAISKLMMNGDGRTQQLLIDGLQNQRAALLEPVVAIEMLSLSPKKEFYPAVYKVFLETKEEPVRLTALQVLGPYKEARAKIISVSLDNNEKEDFRVSALMALYSADKPNIIKYITPILQDRTASARLQTIAIQMSIDVRKAMPYRKSRQGKKADAYDQLILSIKDGKGVNPSEEVRSIANKYLLLVRPNF